MTLTPHLVQILETVQQVDFDLLEKQAQWLGEAVDWKSDEDELGQGLWHFLHALLDTNRQSST